MAIERGRGRKGSQDNKSKNETNKSEVKLEVKEVKEAKEAKSGLMEKKENPSEYFSESTLINMEAMDSFIISINANLVGTGNEVEVIIGEVNVSRHEEQIRHFSGKEDLIFSYASGGDMNSIRDQEVRVL